MSADRTRLKLIIDDGVELKLCWALRYHAQRLLIDCDRPLTPGEAVKIIPLCDNDDLDMREFEALVVHGYEDQAPGRPEQRHMMSLLVDAGPQLHALLRDEIDRSCLASLRRGGREQTHGPEVLSTSRWT